jgi:5-methyltetrahydropteroyltriglutamate--homocysteine methyltransferase
VLETYDIGSLPFEGDFAKFRKGAEEDQLLALLHPSETSPNRRYFEEKVVEGYINKVQAGIDVPVYPQFRDMSQMFLDMLTGIEKRTEGYVATEAIRVRSDKIGIPEVTVLRNNANRIAERTGKPLRLKVCITGPYTLASSFADRQPGMFMTLAESISKIVDANLFKGKYGGVEIVSIEEPPFGLVDDPLLDFGGEGRENLLQAWEHVFSSAKRKDARTAYHLHSTANELFWEVKDADIVESHVDDVLYRSPKTKGLLEKNDKFLKASIAVTVFDTLIRQHLAATENGSEGEVNEKIGLAWTSMRKGALSPFEFIEAVDTMRVRLQRIIEAVGVERVAYAGPECGLRSFPSYDSALELLRRVSIAAHSV